MSAQPPASVGLGGDGDEIAAIQEVETAFSVRLDYGDASNWRTAGDVYQSLRKALPTEEAAKPDVWDRFAEALTRETGVDPKSIRADSTLISQARLWRIAADVNGVVWILAVLGVAIAIGLAML